MDLSKIRGFCRIVNVAGVNVNLLEAGCGYPIVLVHGVNSSIYTWRHNLAELSKYFRVLALDLPGCGFSAKPDDFDYTIQGYAAFLRQTIQELEVEQVFLLGHSLGGAVCQSLAISHPEMVPGLVLADSTSLFGRPVNHDPQLVNNLVLFTYYDKSFITAELLKVCKQTGSSPQAKLAANSVLADSARVRDRPRKLELPPGLIIWGRQDQIFPASQADEVAGLFQRAKVEILENCGHAPHEERASAFNRLTLDFLGQLSAEPPVRGLAEMPFHH